MANERNLKNKTDIQKHHLPSCSIFPGLIKSKMIFRRFNTSNPPFFTAY